MSRRLVLGTEIDEISLSEALAFASACSRERRAAYVVTPNSEIVLRAGNNAALRSAIAASALSLPDSVGVEIAARILGVSLAKRIPGIDFIEALFPLMASEGQSLFLLGGKEGVAARAAEKISLRHPGLIIAGAENGYFDSEREKLLIERINAVSPDVLLVCLGSPGQELWMYRNRHRLKVGLMAGLGGALDVFAGDVRRAPAKWRQFGFEWLYRLIREPSRIKRTWRLPQIVLKALFNRIGG